MMTFLLGCIIGLTLGLTGAGGSVFAVPLLIYVIGLSPQEAIGISLAAVSLCALYGTLIRIRSGHILWLPASVFAIIGSLFSPIGNWLNQFLSTQTLMMSFALLVSVIAIRLWHQAIRQPEFSEIVRSRKSLQLEEASSPVCIMNHLQPFKIGPRCLGGMLMAASLTGLLSGLFGVGGGFIIVPALLYLTRIKMIEAVSTSLFVITLVSGFGFLSYVLHNPMNQTSLLIQVIAGGAIGMTLGVFLSQRLAGPTLQKIFALLMGLTSLWIMLQTYL